MLKIVNEDMTIKKICMFPDISNYHKEKGESIIFSAGVGDKKPRSLSMMYNREMKMRTYRNSFFNCSKNSATILSEKQKDNYLLAGYPWFGVRARDLFIALPGCTLAVGDVEHSTLSCILRCGR